jgi:hypothetical protein
MTQFGRGMASVNGHPFATVRRLDQLSTVHANGLSN